MANQPSTKRASQQVTVGGPSRLAAVTTPSIRSIPVVSPGGQQITPHQILGMDNVDVTIHFNMLNANTAATKTGTATFSNLTSVKTQSLDTLKLHCHMEIDNPTTNLAISGYSIVPMIKDSSNLTNSVNTGPDLSGVRSCVLYQALITVRVIAINNAPATDVVCHCTATLGLQPG